MRLHAFNLLVSTHSSVVHWQNWEKVCDNLYISDSHLKYCVYVRIWNPLVMSRLSIYLHFSYLKTHACLANSSKTIRKLWLKVDWLLFPTSNFSQFPWLCLNPSDDFTSSHQNVLPFSALFEHIKVLLEITLQQLSQQGGIAVWMYLEFNIFGGESTGSSYHQLEYHWTEQQFECSSDDAVGTACKNNAVWNQYLHLYLSILDVNAWENNAWLQEWQRKFLCRWHTELANTQTIASTCSNLPQCWISWISHLIFTTTWNDVAHTFLDLDSRNRLAFSDKLLVELSHCSTSLNFDQKGVAWAQHSQVTYHERKFI